MNVYRICLKVKPEIYFKSDSHYENPKYVWVVSTDLSNAVVYLEKLLKIKYKDYYFQGIQLMDEAEIDD